MNLLNLYWSFVTGNIVKSEESGGLVAVETKFGWILSGCVGVGGKMQSEIRLVRYELVGRMMSQRVKSNGFGSWRVWE